MNLEIERVVYLWMLRIEKRGTYGSLGVQLEEISSKLRIKEVIAGSPAELINLRKGDIIRELDKEKVENALEFHIKLTKRNPGMKVELLIERNNVVMSKTSVLTHNKINK